MAALAYSGRRASETGQFAERGRGVKLRLLMDAVSITGKPSGRRLVKMMRWVACPGRRASTAATLSQQRRVPYELQVDFNPVSTSWQIPGFSGNAGSGRVSRQAGVQQRTREARRFSAKSEPFA